MQASQRMLWLRRLLLLKVFLCFVVWGLPALWASPTVLQLFGFAVPEDPIFLRSFGALAIAMGVAYGYAYRDPLKNAAILRVGVADNGLATLSVLLTALTTGLSSWFVGVSGVLTAGFAIAFLLLTPRGADV